MSSRNYEENGYGHNPDLLIILHCLLCVSNPMRIGCRAKSINLRSTFLMSEMEPDLFR